MSQSGDSKKLVYNRQPNNHTIYTPIDLNGALTSLLAPITSTLNALNDTVTALVHTLNRKDIQDAPKKNIFDVNSANLTADMIASNLHRLGKNYSVLKDQFVSYEQNLNNINNKLASVEKLLTTLVKRQAKRAADSAVMEVFQHFEDYLESLQKHPKSDGASTPSCAEKEPAEPKHGVIDYNTADAYPNGSWLGDPNVSTARVKCPLPADDLMYINAKCTTPEKMALTLLDHLFTKETLSVSNISGKSKLGKKKLDPVLIHGIKCHLVHIFALTEPHWERIKLSIDSKCRTAWKKRRAAIDPEDDSEIYTEDSVRDSQDSEQHAGKAEEEMSARVIRTVQARDLEVLSADHVLHFQDLHTSQVLDGDYIHPMCEEDTDGVLIAQEEGELYSCDGVSFVMEPIMEVLTDDGQDESLITDHDVR